MTAFRHGERLARGELLERGAIGGALRLEMHRVDRAVGPVERVERALVARGELRAVAEGHAGGGRRSDVDHARQSVGVAGRHLARSSAPAEVGAAHDVEDARGPIPRRAHVPLHVGVEREQLALPIEGDVVGIAEAAGPQLPALAIRIGAHDPARRRANADRVPVGILDARLEQVLGPVARARVGVDGLGQIGVIAADDP